ncbi:MBL fold metallo-hydrolase [Erythrobacter sp. JK5]|nr:MBL fold metallo-hydrolase [Erythrobacter sp. JK5]
MDSRLRGNDSGRSLGACVLALSLASCSYPSQTLQTPSAPTDTLSSDIVRFASACEDWDDWDKPAPPFRIYGGTYYVGTCGIAAILILDTDSKGHTLIDMGTDEGAKVVLANIASLGIAANEIATLTISHEHFDHMGGIARIEEASDAIIVSSKEAANVLHSGLPSADDPQAGSHHPPFRPTASLIVVVDPELADVIGPKKLFPVFTPGHSPGALSWQWRECENEECRWIVYADSLSPISSDGYRFSDHPGYVAAYRAGIARLRELKCDILLTPHPSHSRMIERAATGTFEGGMTCAEYADSKTSALDERLATEAGE